MATDGDAATYAEIKTVSCEAFKMDTNKCYSNAYTSSNKENDEKRSSSKKQTRFFVAHFSVCCGDDDGVGHHMCMCYHSTGTDSFTSAATKCM